MNRFFVPFRELRQQPALVVDSVGLGAVLTLAHWRGAATPPAWRDDSSAGSVLRYLRSPAAATGPLAVTANHFDIDGFLGVWALLHPALALAHEPLLRLTATLGDFRELDWANPLAPDALRLACWLNTEEKARFYEPFGATARQRREDEASAEKFAWFLPRFAQVLANPTAVVVGRVEYERVRAATAVMQSPATQLRRYPEIGLVVVKTPASLPYYALFGPTAGFDIVLSIYDNQRYELECKYTTWVDLESRPTLPRLPLAPLAACLNQLENRVENSPANHPSWAADSFTDTGPLLRLTSRKLSKAQRYADPDGRKIHASTIAPAALEAVAVAFLRAGYIGIQPKKYWSWAEIRAASSGGQP